MPYVSAPLPTVPMRSGFFVVRSPLIARHFSPRSKKRNTRFPPR
jgi:hypothetical protein